jgi:hypothetical protein
VSNSIDRQVVPARRSTRRTSERRIGELGELLRRLADRPRRSERRNGQMPGRRRLPPGEVERSNELRTELAILAERSCQLASELATDPTHSAPPVGEDARLPGGSLLPSPSGSAHALADGRLTPTRRWVVRARGADREHGCLRTPRIC